MLCLTFISSAQQKKDDPNIYVYCDIVGNEKLDRSGNVSNSRVSISIIWDGHMLSFYQKRFAKIYNGNQTVFITMIEALNFMSRHGWELDQAYVLEVANNHQTHFIMKKHWSKLDGAERIEYVRGE
jgi:hypothetical protein